MLLRPGLRATFKFPTLNTSSCSSFQSTYTATLRTSSLPSRFQSIFRHRLSTFSPSHSARTRTLPYPSRSGSRTTPFVVTSLILSSGILVPQYFAYPCRNDVSPYSHGRDAKNPLSSDGGKSLNPAAIRQISAGAILGLGLGVVFSALSRMLVLVLGVGIVVWQYAARKGYNFIPVDRMQRYVKGVNLRSAINDNAAFKISFGLMFALTAFGEF